MRQHERYAHRYYGGLRCFPANLTQLRRDISSRPVRRQNPQKFNRDPPPRKRLLFDENQILGRTLAVLTRLQFVFDALSLREARQTGALYGGNMDESVL